MMANPSEALSTLVEMTRALGQPHLDYVIVGEGNTSLRIDEASFWIKASGQGMHGIDASGFVAVKFAPLLALMDSPPPDLHAAMAAAMNLSLIHISEPTRH